MQDLEDGNGERGKTKAGTADFLIELENTRSIKVYLQLHLLLLL